MSILVGYDQGVVKKEGPNKGKNFMVFHLVTDGGNNTIGQNTENVFCFEPEIINKVNEKWINNKVDLLYNVSNGRAYLKDMNLIK